MKKLSSTELKAVLDDHKAWLNGPATGSRADLRGADLRKADLRGVDLRWACLSMADLRGVDLRGADLSEAYLSRADLSEADLSEADLRLVDLRGAGLSKANLSKADLSEANLSETDLRKVDLRGADLRGADLRGADLSGADLPTTIVVPHIDAAILNAVKAKGSLDMSTWHACETTHCRAGWAIVLAGEAGAKLEAEVGPAAAGALIYAASRPNRRVPEFFTSNEDALSDMDKCAAEDPII